MRSDRIMQSRTLSHDYHPRSLDENRYVYAVLSRRSGGVSIGINLNPDKVCNFDCVYCQVDRRVAGKERRVDLEILEREIKDIPECAQEMRPIDPPGPGLARNSRAIPPPRLKLC